MWYRVQALPLPRFHRRVTVLFKRRAGLGGELLERPVQDAADVEIQAGVLRVCQLLDEFDAPEPPFDPAFATHLGK